MNIKKTILIVSFSLVINSTQTMNLEYFKNTISSETLKHNGTLAGLSIGAFYLLNPVFCNLHELGHGLALKTLFNVSATYTFAFLPWKTPHYTYDTTKVPQKGVRKALLHASGTLFGLFAIYTASKCTNIGLEYCSGKTLMEAFFNGLQKSFFPSEHHPVRQIVCLSLIATQLINLIPFKFYIKSDGYQILTALNCVEEKCAN